MKIIGSYVSAVCALAMAGHVRAEETDARWDTYETRSVLSLGRAPSESDAFGVMFDCWPGTGRVVVSDFPRGEHPEGERWNEPLTLRSGAVERTYQAKGTSDEFWARLSATVSSNDGLLRAFARTGKLQAWWGEDNAVSRSEIFKIRQFFDRCRG
jgi:hypothetical protein